MPKRQIATLEGRELGAHLARFADQEAAAMQARAGCAPERCGTCAFRAGTVPNAMPGTLMDALHCIMEGRTFHCHERPHEGDRACAGYLLLRDADAPAVVLDWPWFTTDGDDA